ncbi:MAG: hypothetical protein KC473_02045 [Candidatus Dadabacteria bacterium]|nr:hypothetical protein [Candidatus Dadabacteria bacterium]
MVAEGGRIARCLRPFPVGTLVPALIGLLLSSAMLASPGDLEEGDQRLSGLAADLLNGVSPPGELRLRYSGPRGDYLSFYDLDGHEAYFRYREDRFDRRSERKLRELIPGQAYLVRGSLTGLLTAEGVPISLTAPAWRDELARGNVRLVFEYQGVRPLILDAILY